MREFFRFPNPVNEVSARLVAGGIAITALVILVFQAPLLLIPMAYGFIARAATGPKLSPWGLVVTRVITPRLHLTARPVPGPPKRFAQAMGAVVTTTAAVIYLTAGPGVVVYGLTAMIVVAATLESVFAFCVGCKIFAGLMRLHLIPEAVCLECQDVSLRAKAPA